MTDNETLDLIAKILKGEGVDDEVGEWIERLERATRCPHILNLIRDADTSTTPEMILQKAREYKPIQL